MTNILLITTSPRGAASHSTKVANALVAALERAHPGATTTRRDLGTNPPPHIEEDFATGIFTPADGRNAGQQAAVARSDAYVAELLAADILVVASAMINFGISSPLKSWIDHLLRAGVTFAYTEQGPKGLVTGKKAFLVEARGGVYSDGPMKPFDFQEPYLRTALGFIGITDVTPLRVEGVAFGPEAAEKAAAQALAGIPALLAA